MIFKRLLSLQVVASETSFERSDISSELRAIETIGYVTRHVQAVSDRWHATETLLIAICLAALVVIRPEWPHSGWRWFVAYFVVAGVALAIHIWRRPVERAPSRWVQAVWSATFILGLDVRDRCWFTPSLPTGRGHSRSGPVVDRRSTRSSRPDGFPHAS